MSINLHKERITLSEVLCSQYGQTVVENDIIVPDIKPDMLKILRVTPSVIITHKAVQQDRVYIQGIIHMDILYIPDGETVGHIKSMTANQDFSHFIDALGAKPDMNVTAEAESENMECNMINSRKLNTKCHLGISVKVSIPTELDVATEVECENEVQSRCTRKRVCCATETAEREILIREQLELPSEKPNIAEILRVCAKPCTSELKIVDGKAVVKGEVSVCTLYSAENEKCTVEFTEHTVPFTEILDVDGLKNGMDGEIEYAVKNIYYEIQCDANTENRLLGVEITICAYVRGTEIVEFNAVEDAYALDGEVDISYKDYKIEQLAGISQNQVAGKDMVEVPDYLPPIYEVCDCNGTAVIDDVSIENGKVAINGSLNLNLLYISESSDTPVAGFDHKMPFSHTFDMPDLPENAVCDAKADLDHISYNLSGGRNIEIRSIVAVSVKVMNDNATRLIDSMEWSEENEREIPDVIVYFVQCGDTLWNIAKRYKTTPDAIMTQNGLENDKIKCGQKLYIVRG